MKTILATFLIILLLLPVSAIGEIQTVTHTVKQSFGGSQSPDDARISAVAKAKREALEMAGTYIESLTVVKDSHVDKDEILALAAGVLKAEVVSQKNYASEDAFGIDVVVKVVVDTSVLEERVKKLLQDKTHLTQLKEAQEREKELLQKVAQLEEENRKLTAKKQSTAELKKEFQQASHGLTAVDWYRQALVLWDEEKYTDPKKAIEYLNNAIKLKPDYADAYLSRGIAYDSLRQHQRAIEDYNEAIRLKPDYVEAYNNRGVTLSKMELNDAAIEDYNRAIAINPRYDSAYVNRGVAYAWKKQYDLAIEDYNRAILINPDNPNAYNNRGLSYVKKNQQYDRAIIDFNKAISLNSQYDDAYNNRAAAFFEKKDYERAINDYNLLLSINPKYARAYMGRAFVYSATGNYKQMVADIKTACDLGFDEACKIDKIGR